MTIAEQVEDLYGLQSVSSESLDAPVDDLFRITSSSGQFALKLYNQQSRGRQAVEWEAALVDHLVSHDAPVARPVTSRNGFVETFALRGEDRSAIPYEWAPGTKPAPSEHSFRILGSAAAKIHAAADSFPSTRDRDVYDTAALIDDQLARMKDHLIQAERWAAMQDLARRLKSGFLTEGLTQGLCHMDLTLDNVHLDGDQLTVFDFDSAGWSWRALEPHKVLRESRLCFDAWLDGYRSIRPFSQIDEAAVAAFSIIADLRVVAWGLGVAASSRGTPRLNSSDLTGIVDRWLDWEATNLRQK